MRLCLSIHDSGDWSGRVSCLSSIAGLLSFKTVHRPGDIAQRQNALPVLHEVHTCIYTHTE